MKVKNKIKTIYNATLIFCSDAKINAGQSSLMHVRSRIIEEPLVSEVT